MAISLKLRSFFVPVAQRKKVQNVHSPPRFPPSLSESIVLPFRRCQSIRRVLFQGSLNHGINPSQSA